MPTHLSFPPPVRRVHVRVYAAFARFDGVVIVAFRGEDEDRCKVGSAVQRSNTLHDIAKEKLLRFTLDLDLVALELRACRKLLVYDPIEFLCILV